MQSVTLAVMALLLSFGLTLGNVQRIVKPCKDVCVEMCKCTEKGKSFVVNCSHAGLNEIPKGIPRNTTQLILDKNNITTLNNTSFLNMNVGLSNLLTLSIQHNNLEEIHPEAFEGTPNLQELNLYDNFLERNNSLPQTVFLPLRKSLKILDIRMNMHGDIHTVDYPVSVAELRNLEELRIDCLRDKPFPKVFRSLKRLNKLIFINGRDRVGSLAPNMFASLSKSNITWVDLAGTGQGKIHNKTFSGLKSLKFLDLSNNPMLSSDVSDVLISLRKTPIERIRLSNTGIGSFATPILKKLCPKATLKELTLDQNGIRYIDAIFKKCWSNLEILSLADNFITQKRELVMDILGLKHLVGYNVSWQYRITMDRDFSARNSLVRLHQNKTVKDTHFCEYGMACPVTLPANLWWVDVSHSGFELHYFPMVVSLTNTTMNHVQISKTGIQTMRYPIYCAFNVLWQIETIDASSNALQCINASFFDRNETRCDTSFLKYLYLRNNKLGIIEGNVCNNNSEDTLGFLRPLSGLKKLDLAGNGISSGESLTSLKNSDKLEVLDLSSNNVRDFPLDIGQMTKLSKLNLSNNNMMCLSKSTILQLNDLQKATNRSKRIEVDLSANPLSCNCECLHFYQWMSTTKVFLKNNRTYRCKFDNGKVATLNGLAYIIAELEEKCYETAWLSLYISLITIIYSGITIGCVLYRRRHDIRYVFLKMRLNRNKLKSLLSQDKYKFSAFVSCDHNDARYFVYRKLLPNLETEETKLKFCIAQRNFLVGGTIMGNIMKAMHESKRVICIISEYFINSKWSKEELLIAHQISLERGENIIICIFMPNIKPHQLPSTVRMITKTVTCIKWCPDPKAQKVFWLKLQSALDEGHAESTSIIV